MIYISGKVWLYKEMQREFRAAFSVFRSARGVRLGVSRVSAHITTCRVKFIFSRPLDMAFCLSFLKWCLHTKMLSVN